MGNVASGLPRGMTEARPFQFPPGPRRFFRSSHVGSVYLVHDGQCDHLLASITFMEGTMLEELENQALRLSPKERGELIHRLIVSLEGEPEDTPEAIAKAWDEEIARRVADMEAGRTKWIPADEVMSRLRTKVRDEKNASNQS
jgi:putative addiction module component (TIGR02574 family)